MQLTTTNYPVGSLLGFQALSLVQVLPGIDLTSFGMPTCVRLTGLESTVVVLLSAGQTTYAFAVPTTTAYQGLPIHSQTYAFAPGINAAGVTSSNAVRMVVGN